MSKLLLLKKPAKDQREKVLLLGLVELYLQDGKPVGSNTLKEQGFESLSAATIRNYFVKLEEEGYLKQQHSSGGRIPTHLAYQLYAQTYLKAPLIDKTTERRLHSKLLRETREIGTYLHHVVEVISEESRCAAFLSAPRFEQDFVLDIKLVEVDQNRCLCILITDFGLVHSELLYTEKKLTTSTLKKMEAYFRWKISGTSKPKLSLEEEALATKFYGEVMLRHLVSHTHFSAEDIYKTGFSKLLGYSDFNDATALASGLGLFEDQAALRTLLTDASKAKGLSCWIGGKLEGCSVIAIPYRINQTIVGSVAILGPNRIFYRQLFGILETVSQTLSDTLTQNMYKFKISFRQPERTLLKRSGEKNHLLLENKHDRR